MLDKLFEKISLFKKIDISKIKNPITLIALGILLLFFIIIGANSLKEEIYRFIIIMLGIACFTAIIIRVVEMTETITSFGKEKIDDPMKKMEKKSAEMEDSIDIE